MAEVLTPDICVIGAGSGGLSVAAAAAAFGVPVVLIEKGKMGGDCLNFGCVPSKALLAAAKRADALRKGAPFGIAAVRPVVDFAKVHGHVHGVIAAIAPNDSKERFAGLGVRVIAGAARFKDRHTVAVGDAVEIKARRFVVATGSVPAVPPIPGLDQVPYLTNETIFDLTACPEHLVVIGAGPVGLELAQAHRRLGAEVTVLEAATPLDSDDRECAAVVLDALEREGVRLRAGVEITKVRRVFAKVQVEFATAAGVETVEGTHLLIAAGRQPNLNGLDLDAAGIRYAPHGVAVDPRLRTTNKRVYALGDATGAPKYAHVATYHAGLVIRNALFRMPSRVNPRVIPRVTYTDPELAQVGLREEEARAQNGVIRVLRWPYLENDRAQTERATKGHIKVITDRRGGILGVTIVGAQAGENITTWTLAISQKLKIGALAGLVVPYPSYAETGKYAALTYYTPGLTSARVRRIIAWLRRFN
jgi:pyruvate/2-oxoglutarate dehydrogenase complex dihydrolipoamide dehydrogenase (E3) component